mmetsp:Transcript_10659/g.32068  ORF Transcript_10659/g.32068 Transcript_10659/m.32068 type:complete len:371 (+) Transcript_10659:1927-3039(+)
MKKVAALLHLFVSVVVAFVFFDGPPVLPRRGHRLAATVVAPATVAGVNVNEQLLKVEKEIVEIKAKIDALEAKIEASGLLDKDDLTPGETRKLSTWEKNLDRLALEKANLYRILAGEDVKQARESKSFREADVAHIALATGIDLRSPYGDLKKQLWTTLPDGDFPDARVVSLCTEWRSVSEGSTFFHETSHRAPIDRVLQAVVKEFDGDLVLAHELFVETSRKDESGTTHVLRGNIDYTVMFDHDHMLAAGRSSELPAPLKPMNFVAVEAKRDLIEITKALRQLVAETCTLRKIRTDTGRSGLIYGVLSNAKEWLFIMIDEEDKLHVSDIITVKLGTPEQGALRQVCRVIYAMLDAGLQSERNFRPQPAN